MLFHDFGNFLEPWGSFNGFQLVKIYFSFSFFNFL